MKELSKTAKSELSRREFLKTTAAVGVASMLSATSSGQSTLWSAPPFDQPPIRVSEKGSHSSPDVAASGDRLWIAYVAEGITAGNPDGDRIVVRCYDGTELSETWQVSTRRGVEIHPAISAAADGGAWIAWAAKRNGRWKTLLRHVAPDGKMSAEHIAGEDGECNWFPAVGLDADGNPWVAWERYAQGENRILARRFAQGAWADAVTVDEGHKESYRPAIARDNSGTVWFAWDSYRAPQYTVHARGVRQGEFGPAITVANENPYMNADPTLAADGLGNVWVTYSIPLHRGFRLKAIRNGKVMRPTAPAKEEIGFYTSLAADAENRIWFSSQRSWVWGLDGAGWSRTIDARPEGPWHNQSQLPRVCVLGNTLWFVWEEISGRISMRPYALPPAKSGEPRLAPMEMKDPRPGAIGKTYNPEVAYRDTKYRVYFGDLHTHARASEWWGYHEWSCNVYRDRVGTDFVAPTDHDNATPALLSLSEWEEVQEYTRRFNRPGRFTTFPGWESSAPDQAQIYGHRNVYARTEGLEQINSFSPRGNSPDRLYAALDPEKYLCQVGHHISRSWSPIDWSFYGTEAVPFVEIASGHGIFEYTGNPGKTNDDTPGHAAQDGLAIGHRVGIICASDNHHLGTAGDTHLAGVIAKENTRDGLWEAMRARRVYGCRGGRIFLDFRVNGHMMGEEFFVGKPGPRKISVNVRVPDNGAVGRVEIVRNNVVVHTVESNEANVSFDFEDDGQTATDSTYYYLRVTRLERDRRAGSDNTHRFLGGTPSHRRMAWSSPVWATVVDVHPQDGRLVVPPGEKRTWPVTILNSATALKGTLRMTATSGWTVKPAEASFSVSPETAGKVELEVTAPAESKKEPGVLSFAVEFDGQVLQALRKTRLLTQDYGPVPSSPPYCQ